MTQYVEARPIPEIRGRLHVLAKQHNLPELAELAEATKRRFSGRKARAEQKPITAETCRRVRVYCKMYPTMSNRNVGKVFGIDGGRVSEILNGMRDGRSYEEAHGL
jgi:hypothetical protein